eukprot:Sspe_Gene.97213::Locus_70839_Transcript_1_1_Confidence_1.000_Length_798::g.97213::m.97213/K03098/APOD; apolipoprotein D and lipocalin family protein
MLHSVTLVGVLLLTLSTSASGACSKLPTAVSPFNLTNYLGTWYEIGDTAKFRSEFEKGLRCVQAEYTPNKDGTVRVDNSGYLADGQKSDAVGKAKQKTPGTGALEVSFFGPFYGPYTVIKTLQDSAGNYRASLVWSCSEVLGETVQEAVWMLARSRAIADSDYTALFNYAVQVGIDMKKLDFTKTNQTACP